MNDPQRPPPESVLSAKTADTVLGSNESWTRRMFELAAQMRADGGGPVHDLSLGNPSLEPPARWREAVRSLLADPEADRGRHRYMTNAGFPEVRAFIAEREAKRYDLPFEASDVTMTVGAAGGINVLFRATLDPNDEVIVPAPYFSEYDHYCINAGATLKPVATKFEAGFALDVDAIAATLSERTRVVLINSPNNPTGAIYDAPSLAALGQRLRAHARATGRPLLVIEDSPYRDVVYDRRRVPSMLDHYDDTVLITSHSKDLGLAGERIGYVVLSPKITGRELLGRAISFCNRILGFVNAPALMQRALPLVLGHEDGRVDVGVYESNCKTMAAGLVELGFGLKTPEAGFFLFPRLPDRLRGEGEDEGGDIALTEALREERTIVVPGTAFGVPGHLRLSLCVEPPVVNAALAAFRRVCA